LKKRQGKFLSGFQDFRGRGRESPPYFADPSVCDPEKTGQEEFPPGSKWPGSLFDDLLKRKQRNGFEKSSLSKGGTRRANTEE